MFRVKFDSKLLGLWPKLPLKESINVKEGHSTTLSFSDEEKADVIVSETFGVLLLQDSLTPIQWLSSVQSMLPCFSLAKCFYEMFLLRISQRFQCHLYSVHFNVSVCWIPRTLGRSWPGGMPWVFCPCQWAPCQAEADRVPRALRWCADAAALEFQSIAWCHGRLSSRRIQALGMLEGHRTMFNMFNHMWWSFLKRRTVFSKECTKCLRAFCFNLDWIWHIPFLRTRSFLGAGWLQRRLVAKRSQPRSTAASRVGSSKLRSTPCPTRRGCRSASASSRRNLCVKLTCFLLRIDFLQQIQQQIYSNLVLCFHFAKFNVSGCHDVIISSCHATRWTLRHPHQAISQTRVPRAANGHVQQNRIKKMQQVCLSNMICFTFLVDSTPSAPFGTWKHHEWSQFARRICPPCTARWLFGCCKGPS